MEDFDTFDPYLDGDDFENFCIQEAWEDMSAEFDDDPADFGNEDAGFEDALIPEYGEYGNGEW